MPYLLNILYLLLLVAASPWLIYAAVRHGKYREGFREKFLGLVPRREGSESCVWLHAVSVGEVNLLGVLIKELRGRRPNQAIVVSSTTRTGLELARKKYPDVTTFYCPLDFSWSVRAALRRVRPSLLVLAELELWPNLIGAAVDAGVKVAVVNGRLSEKSFRGYARIRPVMRRLLNKLSLVAVQNDEYRARFAALGCDDARLVTTGSLKFDGATGDRRNPATRRLADLAGFSDQDVVFLA
ncbi:MAG: 3-deoxy-D-manno-octulosonic acid transferase, partial [Planctomycetales bacterium]|nr:3-deoxy-D-manno-octulosonic acid transferase [Planctomycetales bacterium]